MTPVNPIHVGGQNSNQLRQSGQEDGYEAIKIDHVEHVESAGNVVYRVGRCHASHNNIWSRLCASTAEGEWRVETGCGQPETLFRYVPRNTESASAKDGRKFERGVGIRRSAPSSQREFAPPGTELRQFEWFRYRSSRVVFNSFMTTNNSKSLKKRKNLCFGFCFIAPPSRYWHVCIINTHLQYNLLDSTELISIMNCCWMMKRERVRKIIDKADLLFFLFAVWSTRHVLG